MTGRFADQWIRDALGMQGGTDIMYTMVGTDTRTLRAGALFVALKGDRFDAHEFLAQAKDAGATGVVVRRGTSVPEGLVSYEVDDTLRAFGALAAARRREIGGPVVGITGGNGKTSTKEMVAAVLSTRWQTYKTRGNLNNLIGVPQTILEAPDGTDALVIEAGANQPGEIARYREIIAPDIAMVLNAGAGHLEGFGSVEGVIKEKLELTRGVQLAIVGLSPPSLADPERLRTLGVLRVMTAGLTDADVSPASVHLEPDGRPTVTVDGRTFTLAARGMHQATNAMFAWGVARELGLNLDAVAASLERFTVPGGRGELSQHGELTLLNDSYNANPQSFAAVIALVQGMRSGRKLVFVAGTMRELGDHAPALHAEIAEALATLNPDVLALVGDFVPAFAPCRDRFAGRLIEAPDADALAPLLAERLQGDELVVLKASRGVTLERIVPAILSRAATTR